MSSRVEYKRILSIVEQVTDVNALQMLTSKCEDATDARHILVCIMHSRGFTDKKITEFTGLTRQAVFAIKKNFPYRRKRYFVNADYERVYKLVFEDAS